MLTHYFFPLQLKFLLFVCVESKLTVKARLYNIVCCYASFTPQHMTKAMEEEEALRYRGKGEKRWIRRALDVAAIVIMAWTVFLIGFFA